MRECIECAEDVVSGDTDNALAYSILGAAYAKAGEKGMSIYLHSNGHWR